MDVAMRNCTQLSRSVQDHLSAARFLEVDDKEVPYQTLRHSDHRSSYVQRTREHAKSHLRAVGAQRVLGDPKSTLRPLTNVELSIETNQTKRLGVPTSDRLRAQLSGPEQPTTAPCLTEKWRAVCSVKVKCIYALVFGPFLMQNCRAPSDGCGARRAPTVNTKLVSDDMK